MNAQLKYEKFHRGDLVMGLIRYEVLPSGKIITFGISGTDLTTMQFGENIDFDDESDQIIKNNTGATENIAFEYVQNIGFIEVPTTQVSWFKF